ncbi:hypothetical protein AtubIFM54640_002295 [Aspergillus tubingensis]|nr:hypothetical protein AtubIFM54640_002295 [Aspergillus tubingensis]
MQTSHRSTGFYALLQQKRLLVPPSLWTSRHLDILGCQFEEICSLPSSGAESHTSSLSSVDPKLKDDSGSDAARLARSGAVLIKLFTLVNLLDYEGSLLKTRKTGRINFYFAGRVVHRLECATFWRGLQDTLSEHSAADRRLRHPKHQNTYAIPNEILRALDTPTTANCVEWPPIRRSRIPFQPYDTFRRRLEEVLLEER